MTSWLEKAKARFSQNSGAHTPKTPETYLLGVLGVCSERIYEKPDFSDPLVRALLAAAMQTCDVWKDGPEAREEMRKQCLETPPHLRADLLEHLESQLSDERLTTQGVIAPAGEHNAANDSQHASKSEFLNAKARELAATYYLHHFSCATCIAAGRGYDERCADGLALWRAYQESTNT